MSRIKNTMVRNMYGDGYEKEITLDNGEKYIIRNTMAPNIYGDGHEQEIVKKEDTYNSSSSSADWVIGLLVLGAMGFLWFIFKHFDIILNIFW